MLQEFGGGNFISEWRGGFGFFTIFQSALNYLLDVFQKYGASPIAANTFLRSTLAAIFPLFIDLMYAKLGNRWATSRVEFFATLLITIPFVFWKYGPAIRKSENYASNIR